jgi:hypothetical protein
LEVFDLFKLRGKGGGGGYGVTLWSNGGRTVPLGVKLVGYKNGGRTVPFGVKLVGYKCELAIAEDLEVNIFQAAARTQFVQRPSLTCGVALGSPGERLGVHDYEVI